MVIKYPAWQHPESHRWRRCLCNRKSPAGAGIEKLRDQAQASDCAGVNQKFSQLIGYGNF